MAISIRSAVCRFPATRVDLESLFAEEGAELSEEVRERLGIESVRLCREETGSELALAAAQEALERSGVSAPQLDVIVDYTILPQEYLVPAWSMGNKLQADLGAKKAYTLGFSAGGASNFQVALSSAAALIDSDPGVSTALLVGADVTIPGNRVLNPSEPVTVMGDGASALVLTEGDDGDTVMVTRARTVGGLHDVCYIRGGAMAHPDRTDLYRMELDVERSRGADSALTALCGELLKERSLSLNEIAALVTTNLSADDQEAFVSGLGADAEMLVRDNLASHGHVHGTDLVLNYLTARVANEEGGTLLLGSHGMGFMPAATLLRLSGTPS